MIAVLRNPAERTRFLKFMVVGGIGAAVDFSTANLLTYLFHMDLVPAGTISLSCAIVSNFLWNRYWTYPDSRSRHVAHQLGMFAIVNIAGVAIRIPILHFAEPLLLTFFSQDLHLWRPTPAFAARNTTLALAIGVVMLWNYFINRRWTYGDIA